MSESVQQLKKQVDKKFSIHIRSGAADKDGFAVCITCGRKIRWQLMDCGHYEGRSNNATRYDEKNCAPQCKKCNIWNYGEKPKFALYLIKKYGKGILEELREKASQTKQFTIQELRQMINSWGI